MIAKDLQYQLLLKIGNNLESGKDENKVRIVITAMVEEDGCTRSGSDTQGMGLCSVFL